MYHCSDLHIIAPLMQRAYKRETEVENWIQKYDHDVGGQQVGVVESV